MERRFNVMQNNKELKCYRQDFSKHISFGKYPHYNKCKLHTELPNLFCQFFARAHIHTHVRTQVFEQPKSDPWNMRLLSPNPKSRFGASAGFNMKCHFCWIRRPGRNIPIAYKHLNHQSLQMDLM